MWDASRRSGASQHHHRPPRLRARFSCFYMYGRQLLFAVLLWGVTIFRVQHAYLIAAAIPCGHFWWVVEILEAKAKPRRTGKIRKVTKARRFSFKFLKFRRFQGLALCFQNVNNSRKVTTWYYHVVTFGELLRFGKPKQNREERGKLEK